MQTEPITRALKTLEDAGIEREQSMATVKAIAEMQQPLLQAIEKMGSEVESRFEEMDARFEKMDSRFEKMDTRMDARFEKMESRMDARFEKMDTRMDVRFEKMESRITRLQVTVVGIFIPIIFISLRIFTFPN